jgi:hypothetical protein
MLLAGLLLATGTAAAATGPHSPRPQMPAGFTSPAPSAASQAAALAQMTGLTPGQIASRRACPAPAPGQATCDAHMVVLRSTGALVRPRLHPQSALADVRQGKRRPHSAASPSSGAVTTASPADVASTGQAAPAAGTPAWLQQAYDLSYLSATAGTGQTIAVIDAYNDPSAAADLATFRSTYGLPACTATSGCFRQVNQRGYSSSRSLPQNNSGWAAEEALDLDAVSSLCPNCHIILVEANSADEGDLAAAMAEGAKLGATQISASWTIVSTTPLTDQFTWPNVATVAATGDYGYNDDLNTPGDAYPAAAPGVTAAGGTTLAAAASGPRGFGEFAWSDAGSGCATAEPKPSYQTDTGCTGRAYADVSADADPNTGLSVYDSGSGGWVLMGGTSLATPLVAASEAVTGVAGSTPQWAYADSALLNDPVSGSNGLCAASIFYICNAGIGYDGPTGVGSISGQVATGGPGIGGPTAGNGSSYAQSVTSASATLAGGVYPNGSDTTYWWQYGPTTAYGFQTPATDIGSGTAAVPVSDTLPALSPATTYHYRLVAQNSSGTTYGYDFTLTTASASVTPEQTASDGTTTTQSDTTQSPASQTPSTATTPVITTTTTATTPTTTTPVPTTPTTTPTTPLSTPPANPVATSPGAGVARTPAPVITVSPRLSGAARVGATLRVTGGAYRNGTVTSVRFERCARTCVAAGRAGGGASHKLTGADAGYYMRAWVTVTGRGGTVSGWANGTIGPIRSKTAGVAMLRPGAATVHGSAGRALARVGTRRKAAGEVARVGAVGGAVRVWACVLNRTAAVSCTAALTVHGTATLSVTLGSGEQAELVAVARG